MLAALGSEIFFLSLVPIYIEASCPSELPPYEPNVSSSNRFQIHMTSPDRRRDLFWHRFYAPAYIHSKGSSAAGKKPLLFGFISELESSWSSWQGKFGPKIRKGRNDLVGIHKTNVRVYENWASSNIAASNIFCKK